MTKSNHISPLSARSIAVALGVGAGLSWTQFSGDVMRALSPVAVGAIPYGGPVLASLSDIIVLAALICIPAGIGFGKVFELSGLAAPIGRPLVVHSAIFILAGAVCAFLAPVASGLSAADIAWLGLGGPLSEEIVYRGLAIGALMSIAGWRFLPAAFAPAIVFGIAHAAQGDGLGDSIGIVAITGIGGLLFGWLFVRWGFNLWPAIFAHIGLNTLWVVFALGETAIGGWFGNVLRLVLISLIVLSALWLAPTAVRVNSSNSPNGI